MKKLNAVIGGEGSGGVIFPKSQYGRDNCGCSTHFIIFIQQKQSISRLMSTTKLLHAKR